MYDAPKYFTYLSMQVPMFALGLGPANSEAVRRKRRAARTNPMPGMCFKSVCYKNEHSAVCVSILIVAITSTASVCACVRVLHAFVCVTGLDVCCVCVQAWAMEPYPWLRGVRHCRVLHMGGSRG